MDSVVIRNHGSACEGCGLSRNQRTNFLDDEVNSNFVAAAFGNDDVGVAFGRFDKFHVHRANGAQVLLDDGFSGAAALAHIAAHAADEAEIGVGVHKDFNVQEIAKRRIFKDENAFHDQRGARFEVNGRRHTAMLREIIDGPLNSVAFAQGLYMADEQRCIERIGVIEILLGAFFDGEMRQIFVIVILLEYQNFIFGEGFDQAIGDRRLAGSGAAGNSDCERASHV